MNGSLMGMLRGAMPQMQQMAQQRARAPMPANNAGMMQALGAGGYPGLQAPQQAGLGLSPQLAMLRQLGGGQQGGGIGGLLAKLMGGGAGMARGAAPAPRQGAPARGGMSRLAMLRGR